MFSPSRDFELSSVFMSNKVFLLRAVCIWDLFHVSFTTVDQHKGAIPNTLNSGTLFISLHVSQSQTPGVLMHWVVLWFVCGPQSDLASPLCAFSRQLTPPLLWQLSLWCPWRCYACTMQMHISTWDLCEWHLIDTGVFSLSEPQPTETTVQSTYAHTHAFRHAYMPRKRVQHPLTDVTTQLIIKMCKWDWRLPQWNRLIRVVCLITGWIQDSSYLRAYPTGPLRNTAVSTYSRGEEYCDNWPLSDYRHGNWKRLYRLSTCINI